MADTVLHVWFDIPRDGSEQQVPAKQPGRILLPPGTRLARVLKTLLTRHAFRTRVQVAVAEMQGEYI